MENWGGGEARKGQLFGIFAAPSLGAHTPLQRFAALRGRRQAEGGPSLHVCRLGEAARRGGVAAAAPGRWRDREEVKEGTRMRSHSQQGRIG